MLKIEIEKEMRKRNTFFVLEWQTSSMNKEAKIRSVLQNRYANAAILHQKRWFNVNELEAQMLKFPNGKHDDIVDCLSMAIMMLNAVWINKSKAKVVKANRI
jgi:phage terminase large subunit-like protein